MVNGPFYMTLLLILWQLVLITTVCLLSSKRDIPLINFTIHEIHCRRNISLCKICKEPVPSNDMEEHMGTEHVQVMTKYLHLPYSMPAHFPLLLVGVGILTFTRLLMQSLASRGKSTSLFVMVNTFTWTESEGESKLYCLLLA